MAKSPPTIIILRLFNDWEIELLILSSFALQLFLFFLGGLRRRNKHILLQLLLWLAYLSADVVAIYALGYLSRHLSTSTYTDDKLVYKTSNQTQRLKLFWAPFLLVHLGGQDTITAFSIEDNELWLRHMLNLLVQASLVLYVLCKVVPYDRLAVPAIFVFLTGIIKYGERIWALKQGSRKSHMSSSRREVAESAELQQPQGGTELTYPIIVKRALDCEEDVRHLFAGQSFLQMRLRKELHASFKSFDKEYRGLGNDPNLVLKRIEIELSIMYDILFTKYRILHTRFGTILGCVSFMSMMVALVLFIVMGANRTYNFSAIDTTITYVLFVGAIILEGCSFFILTMCPQTWATLEARGCHMLARVAWSILVKVKPETRPLWSNSIGQYNLFDSSIADRKSAGSLFTAITKMVGVDELWNKMRHIKYVQVPTGMKQLLDKISNGSEWGTLILPDSLSWFKDDISRHPFEVALLKLHINTELLFRSMHHLVHDISEEMQKLMDQSKVISDYMMHLLVVDPTMLPVSNNADGLVAKYKRSLRANDGLSMDFSIDDLFPDDPRFRRETREESERALLQEAHPVFELRLEVWFRLLMYAAGKSSPEEHARRLSMGGEFLTLVWMALLHQGIGDQAILGLHLVPPGARLRVSSASAMPNYPLFAR